MTLRRRRCFRSRSRVALATLIGRWRPHPNWTGIQRDGDRLRVFAGDIEHGDGPARNEGLAQLRQVEVQLVDADRQRLERGGGWSRHHGAPFAAGAVARDYVRFAEIDMHCSYSRSGCHNELYLRGSRERDAQIAATAAVRRPAIGQRRFVDADRLPDVAAHPVSPIRVRHGRLRAATHERAGDTGLVRVAALIAVQILKDVTRGSRRAQHWHRHRVLQAYAENPWHLSTRRAKNRIALDVDLNGEGVNEGNRHSGAHYRGSLVSETIDALQLAFSPNSAEPRKHDLLTTDAEQALLIHEAAAVAGLLNAHLQLDDSADARPACAGHPVVSRSAVGDRRLPVWRNRSRDVA